MTKLSWLSPKTEVRPSSIHGRGLHAKTEIEKGEIVGVKGGYVFDRSALASLRPLLGAAEIQIADQLFIGPGSENEREGAMLFLNHSCGPNVGVAGQIIFVAMRRIRAGEELTQDWAMTDDDDESMDCHCGSPDCRGVVTGKDWKRRELQERYRGYFSWFIEQKIRAL